MAPSAVLESSNVQSAIPVKGTKRPEQPTAVQSIGKTKDGRTLKIREYPKFETLQEERVYRKQHLAAAFRIFADRGFDEGVAGHISVRDPILTDHFCESIPNFTHPSYQSVAMENKKEEDRTLIRYQ